MQKEVNEPIADLAEKRDLVLDAIKKALPRKERKFLVFMAGLEDEDNTTDYSKISTLDLIDLFINYEEKNSPQKLNQQRIDYLMIEYVPAYKIFGN
jgi:hypothetical protein